MSKKNDLAYFGVMLDAAREAQAISAGVTHAHFCKDEMLRHALTHLLDTIARTAAKLPSESRAQHPGVDWSGLATTRQQLDDYLDVDPEDVWNAVQRLSALIHALAAFMPSEPPSAGVASPRPRRIAIPLPHDELAAFCRKWGICRLSLFGSVVRDDFTPESDIDVLVELRRDSHPGLRLYSDIPDELSAIFGGRKVDLVTFGSINRWIRNDILAEAVDVCLTPPEPPSA
jgi:predicted nucleotidyltransferase/uncharacterized protein with HEPN domain